MPVASHRIRYLVLAFVLAWLALTLLTRPAHGAWSADPVEVHATTALCPMVSAADDGHLGAIIVWQENTATGGMLKAQHLLANGALDPAWSGPALVSTMDITRAAIGAVSDRDGGAFVWWMENAQLFLTRVSRAGVVDAAWPARGRSLGTLSTLNLRPSVAADGIGGIYLAWLGGVLADAAPRAVHLGPTNTGAGGWPNGVKVLGTTPGVFESVNSLAIDAASDGGLWLTIATTDLSTFEPAPGEVRLARYTSAGLPASGWDARGVTLAPFRGDLLTNSGQWGPTPRMGLVAVANSVGAAAFVMWTAVAGDGTGMIQLPEFRLVRVLGDGAIAPGWAPDGLLVGGLDLYTWPDLGSPASLRVLADGSGGVFEGVPIYGTEGYSAMRFTRRSASGAVEPGGITTDQSGLVIASRGDGGMFAATFFPSGPYGPYSPSAYISATQSAPGGSYTEWHDEPVLDWYGDVGLAATGDGGAIFAWSQVRERFGVFAIRLGPAGAVTDVTPTPVVGPPSLRVRFVRGSGVHAVASFSGSPRLSLSLHDLAGRRVAAVSSDATLGAEVVFPGTRELPGGVYFARASDGTRERRARVIVLR
jgi:hypothetical protein